MRITTFDLTTALKISEEISMFRMLLVAYVAIPFLAAATFTASPAISGNLLSCPCGQCEEGCGCCAGDTCTCADCVCESCGCEGSTSLTSLRADGEKSSCCAAGSCTATMPPSTLVSSQSDCNCADCPEGCEGCKDCTEDECVCTECDDEK